MFYYGIQDAYQFLIFFSQPSKKNDKKKMSFYRLL